MTSKGIYGDGGVGRGRCRGLGASERSGFASSKKRRAAELRDMTARRKDDGERDYGDGAATVASAMVRESEGERQGASRRVQGVGGAT